MDNANTLTGQSAQRVGSQQQSALLDLFRKPSATQASPQPQSVEPATIPAVSSPTLSDTTVTGRKSTANEMTRILPTKGKNKAPLQKSAKQLNDGIRENNTDRRAAGGRAHASSNPRSQRASSKTNGKPEQKIPQFSILQRPGSSAGKAAPAPQSPLRFENLNQNQPSIQPQVLKRRTSGATSETEKGAITAARENQTQAQIQRNNPLLDLLNGRGGSGSPPVIKTPEPPPAPQLQPERKTSHHGALPVGSHQKQQNLLNLFTKPGSFPQLGGSPGTPISPFTLGTPAASKSRDASFSEQSDASRSRLGSMASIRSGRSSGQQTPTEAKAFMLGYLDGVVQKEGNRGGKL